MRCTRLSLSLALLSLSPRSALLLFFQLTGGEREGGGCTLCMYVLRASSCALSWAPPLCPHSAQAGPRRRTYAVDTRLSLSPLALFFPLMGREGREREREAVVHR